MKYYSTRDNSLQASFTNVLFQGLSKEGGLFLPLNFPTVEINEFRNKSYEEVAFNIIKPFIGNEILKEDLYEIINLYAGKNSGSCICIQHGWDPMFFTGFRDMHYTSFLSWGNELSSMLKKYNPLQKFENVGCHVHNVNLEKSISRKIAFFLQPTCPIVSKQDIDEFIRLIVSVANLLTTSGLNFKLLLNVNRTYSQR